jgi:hypothetical protein
VKNDMGRMHDLQQSMRLNNIESDLFSKRTNMHNQTMDKQMNVNSRLMKSQFEKHNAREGYKDKQHNRYQTSDVAGDKI